MARRLHLILLASLLGAFSAETALAAPQLSLPKKRRSAPAAKKEAPEREVGAGIPGEVKKLAGDGSASGSVAGGKVDTKSKVEPILGANGKPVGTATTTRINSPGTGTAGIGVESDDQREARRDGALLIPRRRVDSGAAVAPAVAPAGAPAGAPDGAPDGAPAQALRPDPLDDPLASLPSDRRAARVLYEQLLKQRRVSDPTVSDISDRLSRLGTDGLDVARFALRHEEAPVAFAGARALLIAGDGGDADLVVRLLRGNAPSKAAPSILSELMERDPVRGSNALLAELCAHKGGQIRRAARKALRSRVTVDELPLLSAAISSKSADARRGALELVARVDDPAAVDILLDAITDGSTSVAKVAIEAITRSEDPRIDLELQRRTFATGSLGRNESLLLLTICEREDRATEPILRNQAVESLLRALGSPLPLVSNVAAVALAGIGFRSVDAGATPWLDTTVPSTLVGVASGARFFDGFDLVREPSLRRLRQITGVTHGDDGPKWASWWVGAKPTFSATRAVMPVGPGDFGRIVVMTHDPSQGRPLVLAGPELASDPDWKVPEGATVRYMLPSDAMELVDLMTAEGVFSFERLPGPRGSIGLDGRSLEVRLNGRRKSFRFSAGLNQPWFSRILTRVFGLERRLRWQGYLVASAHGKTRDVFLQEALWWSAHPEEGERAQRVEDLAYQYLAAAKPKDRQEAVLDLIELDDAFQTASMDDMSKLQALMEDGPVFDEGVRLMSDLCLRAADIGSTGPDRPAITDAQRSAAQSIIATLHAGFGSLALPKIEEILQRLERSDVIAAAKDSRSLLRMAAAGVLGATPPPNDEVARASEVELLFGLALDSDEDVQVAAIRSLGVLRPERADKMVLQRAQDGPPRVRSAALEAVGYFGGSDAVEVLVRGLTDLDERFHLPAARGLARLGSPETSPLLVSLLRSSMTPAIRAEAKAGLLQLGRVAYPDLGSAMRSQDRGLRRSAALILSEQLEPRTVPVLARLSLEDPADAEVLEELAVLTCVDYRGDDLPSDGYYRFWDETDRRDAFSWFEAALGRRGLSTPGREDFKSPGTTESREYLLSLLVQLDDDDVLRERARRELQRLLGVRIGRIPKGERAQGEWLQSVMKIIRGENPEPSAGGALSPELWDGVDPGVRR